MSVYVCAYLHHYEDLGGGLYDVVETANVLMAQVPHGLDLHLHTGQVILGWQTISLLIEKCVKFK